jgi:hypothetical protein
MPSVTQRPVSRRYTPSHTCTTAALSLAIAAALPLATASATFTSAATLQGVQTGSVAWGDYDNDGDLDILLTGTDTGGSGYVRQAIIYRNDGSDTFTSVATLFDCSRITASQRGATAMLRQKLYRLHPWTNAHCCITCAPHPHPPVPIPYHGVLSERYSPERSAGFGGPS